MSSLVSILFWLVVGYFIIKNLDSSKKKNSKKTSSKKAKPKKHNRNTTHADIGSSRRHTSTHTTTPEVLRRAKQNVAEDFDDDKTTEKKDTAYYENVFGSSSPATSVHNKQKHLSSSAASVYDTQTPDISTAIDVDDLLSKTQDLIVIGYHAKLPYERDFIAEGMALIDQYKN